MGMILEAQGAEVGKVNYRVLDVRHVPAAERSLLVLQAFEAIHSRSSFVLITDVNPEMLHNQFDLELGDRCAWEVLQNGPEIWQVFISKR